MGEGEGGQQGARATQGQALLMKWHLIASQGSFACISCPLPQQRTREYMDPPSTHTNIATCHDNAWLQVASEACADAVSDAMTDLCGGADPVASIYSMATTCASAMAQLQTSTIAGAEVGALGTAHRVAFVVAKVKGRSLARLERRAPKWRWQLAAAGQCLYGAHSWGRGALGQPAAARTSSGCCNWQGASPHDGGDCAGGGGSTDDAPPQLNHHPTAAAAHK